MNLEELEAKVKILEGKLTEVQDIQEIEKLQRIYGYYIDNRMYDEAIALFSDDTESFELNEVGVYLGKEGVKRFLKEGMGSSLSAVNPKTAQRLSLHMQLQGVVHVDPGGKTAQGRWQCLMALNWPIDGEPRAVWAHGLYENQYIKEDGKWKFKKLCFFIAFRSPADEGWIKTPLLETSFQQTLKPDKLTSFYDTYPFAYRVPFHWK